ncbi:hypothetical protein H0H92_008071 [Tricholoma furcatifolium]|nr:hypothetical protein H0H92_008071 [Tricholoma furcatifolium]
MGKVEEARKKLLLANRSWGDKPGTVLPVISAKEHTETERIDRAQHSPPSISRSLSPLSSLTDSDVDGSPFTDVALVNTTVTAGVTSSKRQRLILDYVEVPNASYKLSQSSVN